MDNDASPILAAASGEADEPRLAGAGGAGDPRRLVGPSGRQPAAGRLPAILRPRRGLPAVRRGRPLVRRPDVLLGPDRPRPPAPGGRGGGARQAARGDCMNGPAPVLVELAELLVALVPHADWCLFGKNGTDATTTCVTIARAATGRRKVLVAAGAYHGAVPWCSPQRRRRDRRGPGASAAVHLQRRAKRRAAVERAGGDLAAILVSAFRHDMGQRQELPTSEFARGVRALCDATGAALILDDVRAGFRLRSRRVVGNARRAAGPRGLEQGDRQRPPAGGRDRAGAVPRGGDTGVHHRLVLVRRGADGGRGGDAVGAAPHRRPGA